MKSFAKLIFALIFLTSFSSSGLFSQPYKWVVINNQNSNGELHSDTVNCIVMRNPKAWLSDYNYLSSRLKTDISDNHTGGGNMEFGEFVFDSQGIIWLTTTNNGLYSFDRDNGWDHYTKDNYPAQTNHSTSIALDSSHKIWLGSEGGLANTSDGGNTWKDYYSLLDSVGKYVTSIVVDTNNNKWIGTDNGLVKYRNGQTTIYNVHNGLPDNYIIKLF